MPVSVLLVDDTGFLRSMLREILEASGRYRVLAEAGDGEAALLLHPELRPQLVITDVIMPGLDGIEMTRALLSTDPSARVVVAASPDQEGAIHQALSAGAREFLLKPYAGPQILRHLVEEDLPTLPPEANHRDLILHLMLDPDTVAPAARARVLIRQTRRWGTLLGTSPPEEALKPGTDLSEIEISLTTRYLPGDLEKRFRRLPGVESLSVQRASARGTGVESLLPAVRSPLRGTLRIRGTLLDRMLDRTESSLRAQAHLSHLCSGHPRESSSRPALEDLGRMLGEMRTEILAARLVPFDRIAGPLTRSVEKKARDRSRQVRLQIEGGEHRLDLAVLEELGRMLERLLPCLVQRCFPRSDILRQLGRPEEHILRLIVSRADTSAVVVVDLEGISEEPEPVLEQLELGEQVRSLGGILRVVRAGPAPRIELVIPAGASLVRSYLCQVGGRLIAIPVGDVEQALELDTGRIRVRNGRSFWEEAPGSAIPLVRVQRSPWVQAEGISLPEFPALIYRVGPQRYALALDTVLGEADVVVRPVDPWTWKRGAAAAALLPDGEIALIPDLSRLARAH